MPDLPKPLPKPDALRPPDTLRQPDPAPNPAAHPAPPPEVPAVPSPKPDLWAKPSLKPDALRHALPKPALLPKPVLPAVLPAEPPPKLVAPSQPFVPPNLPKPDAPRPLDSPPLLPLEGPDEDPQPPVETSEDLPGAREKKAVKQDSGLSSLDAAHAFGSVLFSGFGRAIILIVVCMLAFGFTEACYRISLIDDGWRAGGVKGVFEALLAAPGSLFTSPYDWVSSLVAGLLKPLGVPYLMLVVGGLILAVRSEFHIVKLGMFYAVLTCIQAAAYFEMKNPVSLLFWIAVLAGMVWLYRWFWRQQNAPEEEPSGVEEEDTHD